MAYKKNRLASKLRMVTQKLVKPMASFLFKKSTSTSTKAEKTKPEFSTVPHTPLWKHPSELKQSEYIAEMDENAANEALEAKLRQLIVNEYSTSIPAMRTVSLRIEGQLTIIPTTPTSVCSFDLAGTFWTADADLCWRQTSDSLRQKAEKQSPVPLANC